MSECSPDLASIPKVGESTSIQSYLTKSHTGVEVNPALLVKPEERVLANGIRLVEDSIIMKANATKVSADTSPLIHHSSSMRKIYPKKHDAEPDPVLGITLQQMMSIYS